jgi:hypothetical protein
MFRVLGFFAGGMLLATLGSGVLVGTVLLERFDTENQFPLDANCLGNRCFRVTGADVSGDNLDVELSLYRPTGPFLLDELSYHVGHVRSRLRLRNGLPLGSRDLIPACSLDNSDTGVVRGECVIRYELSDLRRRPEAGAQLTLELFQRSGRVAVDFAMP